MNVDADGQPLTHRIAPRVSKLSLKIFLTVPIVSAPQCPMLCVPPLVKRLCAPPYFTNKKGKRVQKGSNRFFTPFFHVCNCEQKLVNTYSVLLQKLNRCFFVS